MRLKRKRSTEPRIERAGNWLHDAHRDRRRFAPLPAELGPRDVADAYAIQSEFVAARTRELGRIGGYKIALTTPAMRRMVGLDDAIAGELLEHAIHSSPAQVRAADYVNLIVECEIGFELGDDLPAIGAPYDRERAGAAVAAAMPAFELADDRKADYKGLSAHALMLIADNAWNEGVVLGAPVQDWRSVDLASLKGRLSVNGAHAGEGHGRDVMGHPLEALAWLANNLAGRGLGLRRGEVVITGSLVASYFPKPGDRIRFDAGALGSIELSIE